LTTSSEAAGMRPRFCPPGAGRPVSAPEPDDQAAHRGRGGADRIRGARLDGPVVGAGGGCRFRASRPGGAIAASLPAGDHSVGRLDPAGQHVSLPGCDGSDRGDRAAGANLDRPGVCRAGHPAGRRPRSVRAPDLWRLDRCRGADDGPRGARLLGADPAGGDPRPAGHPYPARAALCPGGWDGAASGGIADRSAGLPAMSLSLRAVTYRYAGSNRAVLEALDLIVEPGEVVGVVGANEAGKSSLCLVAAGLAPGTIGGRLDGEVLTDGVSSTAARPYELAQRCGILFQNPTTQLSGTTATA